MTLIIALVLAFCFGTVMAGMPFGVGLVLGTFIAYAVVTCVHLFSAINK